MAFDSKEYKKEWKLRNPEKIREYAIRQRQKKGPPSDEQRAYKRNYDLLRCFGITVEQYDELLKAQQGCCAICDRTDADQRGHRLHVDHNHKTREIRGLLCGSCNKDLIGRRTDPNVFRRAAEYLEKQYTGFYVPEDAPKRRRRRKKVTNV